MCVIFHLFQLSKMSNESFVEKLKKIAREKKKKQEEAFCMNESELQNEEVVATKDKTWRKG